MHFSYVLASALREMNQTKEITEAPKDCDNSGSIWESGRELFYFIRKQVMLNGETGKVAFDDQGDRINAEYNIVNIQKENGISKHIAVGQFYFHRVCHIFINYKFYLFLIQIAYMDIYLFVYN